ncbi:diguanylate cyclase (GGDEF)-like protein [Paucimonas lemoignei]|uniref:diguanylate cyclase n=1 Tax=Paucimonas lemoignei TaxID=29443 RepID=A0A4R3I243_PAULE|nr:diguanylate cyclase [Paucimonas lemoignei]TCS39284.1 diguanylate cyclase (GGDEF)-like protein [Paucimonas lemoignei]
MSVENTQVVIGNEARLKLFQSLSDAADLRTVLETVAAAALKWSDYEATLINLIDDRHENLVCHWSSLPTELATHRDTFIYYSFPLASKDLNVQCFKEGKPVIADRSDVEALAGATWARFKRWAMQSVAIVPIRPMEESEPIGTLMVFCKNRTPHQGDLEFLQELCALAGKRIRAAKRQEELAQRERVVTNAINEQTEFLRFVNQVNVVNAREEIYRLISEECLRRFAVDLISIWLKENDGYVCKSTIAINPNYMPIAQKLSEYYARTVFDDSDFAVTISEVMTQNHPMFIEDVAAIRHVPMSDRVNEILDIIGTPRTFIHMPISHENRPLAVLTFATVRDVFHPNENQFRTIKLLSQFFSTLLVNADVYETMKRQQTIVESLNTKLASEVTVLGERALKDRLSGLYNFGYFHDALDRRVSEFSRHGGSMPLSLILFDIDHFKALNDKHGHLMGNLVIKEFARRLAKRVRKADIACRFGGEEFAVILPGCSLHAAKQFAETIRKWIEKIPVETDTGPIIVTVSAGCSTCKTGDTDSDLLERADRALYRAKRNGRNRVEAD